MSGLDLTVLLTILTPTTAAGSALVGLILGLLFLPTLGDVIGADKARSGWAVALALEVVGVAFLLELMVSRWLDGSDLWPAYLGSLVLWSIMVGVAALTTRWARR